MASAPASESPVASEIYKVGLHSVTAESPRVLVIKLVGELHGNELALIMKRQDEWSREKGRYFVLASLRELTGVARDARPVLKEHLWSEHPAELVIAYGASFAVRTIGEMVVRARRALNATDPVPTKFVATENDARKLLASLLDKGIS